MTPEVSAPAKETPADELPQPDNANAEVIPDAAQMEHILELPKVKDLNAEYSALLTKKKALYPEYRKTRDEMQEIVKAQKNVELFFAEEKDSKQVEQIR